MQMRFILFFLLGLEKLECFVFFRSVGGYTNQCIFFFVGSKNSIFFEGFVIFCTKSKEPLIYFVYVYLLYFYSGCNLKLMRFSWLAIDWSRTYKLYS